MTSTDDRAANTFALSGWLFADLLLALAVIFLVGNSASAPHPTPTSTPTVTPTLLLSGAPTLTPTSTYPLEELVTPGPTAAPTATPQTALSMEPIVYDFSVDISEERLREDLETLLGDQQPGFVMIYGTAPDPAEGDRFARSAADLLHRALPDKFKAGVTVMEPLHFISGNPNAYGLVQLKIFVFTQYIGTGPE